MDSNDTIALAPAGKLLVAIDNTAIRHLDLDSGKTIQTLSEGEDRGLLRTACSHAVAGDGKMIYQPEGHHGTQWLYLMPFSPDALRLPNEADAWYPPHMDTTAYSQDPIVNPLVDGRLFIRGADGIYCYDLRTKKGEYEGDDNTRLFPPAAQRIRWQESLQWTISPVIKIDRRSL